MVYLRIGNKIVNTDNIVDADVYEQGEYLSPHGEGSSAADVLTRSL